MTQTLQADCFHSSAQVASNTAPNGIISSHFPKIASTSPSDRIVQEQNIPECSLEQQEYHQHAVLGDHAWWHRCGLDSKSTTRQNLWRKVMVSLLLASILGGVLGAILTHRRIDAPALDDSIQGEASQRADIDGANARLTSIRLALRDFSGPASFVDPNTPQSQAVDWLVYEDSVIESISDPNLLQRYALLTLAFATNGHLWSVPAPWESLPSIHECDFEGIQCNDELEVTFMTLRQRKIAGTLPEELGLLSNLKSLLLGVNPIEGSLPDGIYRLTNLETLELGQTELSSTISDDIGNLSNLKILDLTQTYLQGNLPNSMKKLTNLELAFFTSAYSLSGPIFDFILSWPKLVHFQSSDAAFSGSIPIEISAISNLEVLAIIDGKISGTIPTEIGMLSDLRRFAVVSTALSGSLPSEVGNLQHLDVLMVHGGNVTGTIPTELGRLTSLQILQLMSSNISGNIPSELGLLTDLHSIRLVGNELDGPIPTELENLSSMTLLDLAQNNLSGTIPEELCSDTLIIHYGCGTECSCCRIACE